MDVFKHMIQFYWSQTEASLYFKLYLAFLTCIFPTTKFLKLINTCRCKDHLMISNAFNWLDQGFSIIVMPLSIADFIHSISILTVHASSYLVVVWILVDSENLFVMLVQFQVLERHLVLVLLQIKRWDTGIFRDILTQFSSDLCWKPISFQLPWFIFYLCYFN